jgi:iron complex outermembrane recepter protein
VGLLRTRYSEFVAGPEGREQAHAPRWQYATGLQYRDASGWFGRVEVTGRDAFYFSDSHDQRSERYHLVNARFGWDDGRLAVYAWGRNLFDENYSVRGFFFGNEPPDFADTLYLRRGDPRHFGVTLRYRM